jgi:hypothetical protein
MQWCGFGMFRVKMQELLNNFVAQNSIKSNINQIKTKISLEKRGARSQCCSKALDEGDFFKMVL